LELPEEPGVSQSEVVDGFPQLSPVAFSTGDAGDAFELLDGVVAEFDAGLPHSSD
jgi:hypothetical protein